MTFTQLRLADHRVLVRGTDNLGTTGETVVDSAQWDDIQLEVNGNAAVNAFNRTVEEFYRPITDAAAEANEALAKEDEGKYFVIDEPVAGVPESKGHRVRLSHDSQVLQLLQSKAGHDRLLWVNGSLEISESATPFQTQASSAFSGLSAQGSDTE